MASLLPLLYFHLTSLSQNLYLWKNVLFTDDASDSTVVTVSNEEVEILCHKRSDAHSVLFNSSLLIFIN